ncbi:MAG: arsenate reductase ArsC [bacterium]|nr:arsenate reductase ArsC [bacterium]
MTGREVVIEVGGADGDPRVQAALALAGEVARRLGPGVGVSSGAAGPAGALRLAVDGRELEVGSGDTPPAWLLEAAVCRAQDRRGYLFLCVANSARSQLAEGIARAMAPARIAVMSAGSQPTQVRPEAIAVLAEIGLDSAGQRSKNVAEIDPATVDTVVTLCGEEECPIFLGAAARLHWGLPDPAGAGLDAFRAVRDELRRRLAVVFGTTGFGAGGC